MELIMAKKSTSITARVLVAVTIAGIALQPNQLVKAETDLLKHHLDNNELSDNEADVDYCVQEDAEVVDITALLNKKSTDDNNKDLKLEE